MARRRHHEIAGFADSHEIAHHFRMRDRKRTAGLDLRFEFGHDRAVRGEHIAEAHRDESRGSLLFVTPVRKVVIERLAIHLGKALRGTEHGYRLDRLVSRRSLRTRSRVLSSVDVELSTLVWDRTPLNITTQFGLTGHVPNFRVIISLPIRF